MTKQERDELRKFIAAREKRDNDPAGEFNYKFVLSLLDKIDELERERDAALTSIAGMTSDVKDLIRERDGLIDALARLTDAASDWVDDTEEDCGHHPEWQALSECAAECRRLLSSKSAAKPHGVKND